MIFTLEIGHDKIDGLIGIDLKLYWVLLSVAGALSMKAPWNFARSSPTRFLEDVVSEKIKLELPQTDHKVKVLNHSKLMIGLQKSKKKASKFLHDILIGCDFYVLVDLSDRFPCVKLCTEDTKNAIHFKNWLDSYKKHLGLSQQPRNLSSNMSPPVVSSSIAETSFPRMPLTSMGDSPASPSTLQAAASLLTLRPPTAPVPNVRAAASPSPRIMHRSASMSSSPRLSLASSQYSPPSLQYMSAPAPYVSEASTVYSPTSPPYVSAASPRYSSMSPPYVSAASPRYSSMSPPYGPAASPRYSSMSPPHVPAATPRYSPTSPPYASAASSQYSPMSFPHVPPPSPVSLLSPPKSRFRLGSPKPVSPTPRFPSQSSRVLQKTQPSENVCPHCNAQKDKSYVINKNLSSESYTLFSNSTPRVKIMTFYGAIVEDSIVL